MYVRVLYVSKNDCGDLNKSNYATSRNKKNIASDQKKQTFSVSHLDVTQLDKRC